MSNAHSPPEGGTLSTKGFSGAKISFDYNSGRVIKRGKGVGMQARYCQLLGTSVCPEIFGFSSDSYRMEILKEPKDMLELTPQWTDNTIIEAKRKLSEHVWSKPIAVTAINMAWRQHLAIWAEKFSYDIRALVFNLYPHVILTQRLIHGDPTLANMMYRNNGELVITDPIIPSGMIPGLFEVDLGKMAQSLLGWERVIANWRGYMDEEQPMADSVVCAGLTDEFKYKVSFWTMIHLLRILPYVPDTPEGKNIETWVRTGAHFIYTHLTQEILL